jgi:Tfp pilus assembly protein PilX
METESQGLLQGVRERAIPASSSRQAGAVLPVALVLLVVMTIAGLLSARRATTNDAIAHNLRVNEIAQQSAESALRHCEAVVIDMVDNAGANHPNDVMRVGSTEIADPQTATALWLQPANWADGSANRIVAPLSFDAGVRAESRGVPPPHCIAEALANGRYLITARGLSADATFDANGRLESGSEVWLQSILSPQVPIQSAGGGNA